MDTVFVLLLLLLPLSSRASELLEQTRAEAEDQSQRFLPLGYGASELLNNDLEQTNTEILDEAEVLDEDRSQRFLTQLAKINEKLKKQEETIQKLQTENLNQQKNLNQFEEEMEELRTENRGRAAEVQMLKSQVDSLRTHAEDGRVAFSAALVESGSGHYGPFSEHRTLIFRRVISNYGNAYDRNRGTFTAPVKGVYHFDFFCNVGAGPPATQVSLRKNGARVVSTFQYQPEGHGTAGNAVSLFLNVGDTVYLRLFQRYRIWDNSDHYSTFSGRLLFLL